MSEEPLTEKEYPLLNIPDDQLTPEQIKEKKKQKFLKTASEGRERAKQKRQEQKAKQDKERQLEEEKRLTNPDQWLQEQKKNTLY